MSSCCPCTVLKVSGEPCFRYEGNRAKCRTGVTDPVNEQIRAPQIRLNQPSDCLGCDCEESWQIEVFKKRAR